MKTHISKITFSNKVKDSYEGSASFQEFSRVAEDLSLADSIHMYWTTSREIEKVFDKKFETMLVGLFNVTFEISFEGNTYKVGGKLSFDHNAREGEIYSFFFAIIKSSTNNGISIDNETGVTNINDHMERMKNIWDNRDEFQLVHNNSADIEAALGLYSDLLSAKEESETLAIVFVKFNKGSLALLDKSITNEEWFEDYKTSNSIEKIGKNWYTNMNFSKNIKSKYIIKENLVHVEYFEKNKIEKSIKPTLLDIAKTEGSIYFSDEKRLSLSSNTKVSAKLMDFQLKIREKDYEGKKHMTQFLNLVIDAPKNIESPYLHVANMANMIKNKTILSVIDKIRSGHIPNNRVFQFLFNEGKYREAEIESWGIDQYDIDSELEEMGLNKMQEQAFKICADNKSLAFVQGPPGTGKTHLIKNLADFFSKNDKKVLISSQTNVAVENVLNKIWEDDNMHDIAIKAESNNKSNYSEGKIGEAIQSKIERITGFDLSGMKEPSINEIQSTNKYKIVGSTTTSSSLDSRKWREWSNKIDVLIVDEISKSSVPELIRYTLNAKKIIYIGDQKQLPPMDEIDEKTLNEYSEEDKDIINRYIHASIFANKYEDMKKVGRAVMLNENYRSLPVIANLYSRFYDNKLVPMRGENDSIIKYKENIVPDKPYTFIASLNSKELSDGFSRYNIQEIDIVLNLIEKLKQNLDNPGKYTIAVISQYGAQVSHMQKAGVLLAMKEAGFSRFKLNTIDAFQGDQADIVIISTVVTGARGNAGFFGDFRRINVAISRAKDQLYLIGNDLFLSRIPSKGDTNEYKMYLREIVDAAKNNDTESDFIMKRGN